MTGHWNVRNVALRNIDSLGQGQRYDLRFQWYECPYSVRQRVLCNFHVLAHNFFRESPSGSHESITYRSAIDRIFRENSRWIREFTTIEHPLHSEIAVRACSSDNTSPATTWPISRPLARAVAVICNTQQDYTISVSTFQMYAAGSRRPSFNSVSDGPLTGKCDGQNL